MFIRTEGDAKSGDPEVPPRATGSDRTSRSIMPGPVRSRRQVAAGRTRFLFDFIPRREWGVPRQPILITVTKSDGEWQQLKPAILGAIMEPLHERGAPMLHERERSRSVEDADEFFEESDAETVAAIKELIDTRVRPAVANDGGDITFRGFKDGVVYLNMQGSCSGCPSSTATLRHGIQNLLRHYVPEVVEVRPI